MPATALQPSHGRDSPSAVGRKRIPGYVAMTVRLSPLAAELVREEAAEQGIPVSQFIREATIARAAWERARRGEPLDKLEELLKERRKD